MTRAKPPARPFDIAQRRPRRYLAEFDGARVDPACKALGGPRKPIRDAHNAPRNPVRDAHNALCKT